jgi:hypothetical protein
MADFLAKEPGGHAIARRLGAQDPLIARDVDNAECKLQDTRRFLRAPFARLRRDAAAADPEAIEYNKRAVSPDNPTQILGVRLVETFDL